MKTNMVAPQELGRSNGGTAASKGWSQVNKDDHHCSRAHPVPNSLKNIDIDNRNGNRVHGRFKDHGFHSRKTARKEQAPKCRSKVAPRFGDYKSKKRPPTSKKTPHGSLKRFSKKMVDHEVKHFRKQDKHKIARNVQRNAPRKANWNFGAPQASTIFANRFGASFTSPDQATTGFIRMGTELEDVVTGPFASTLEFAQKLTHNFEDGLHAMAQGEEKRLQASNKAIETLKFLGHDVTNK